MYLMYSFICWFLCFARFLKEENLPVYTTQTRYTALPTTYFLTPLKV